MIIEWHLDVDLNDDGDFDGGVEDWTVDVRHISCRMGRDYASQVSGKSSHGVLAATLLNINGQYSPNLNTNLGPSLLCRLRYVTAGPVDHVVWQGYTDTILPRGGGGIPTAELRASGPLILLSRAKISPPAFPSGEASGDVVDAILDEAMFPAGDRDIETGSSTLGAAFWNDVFALDIVREVEETEFGFLHESKDGKIIFHGRNHRVTDARSTTSQAIFSDAIFADNQYLVGVQQQDPWRDIINELKTTVQVFNTGALAVLWTYNGGTISLPAGESITLIAEWPTAANGQPDGAYVNAWTTPAVGTDVTQTGVANGDIGIAVVKSANQMEIEITNNHGSASADLTLVQARGTPVVKLEPVVVVSRNLDSQTKHKSIRSSTLPGKWYANVNDAQSIGDALVSLYGFSLPVVTVPFALNQDQAMFDELIELQIADRVSITVTGPNTPLGINDDFFIEAISFDINFETSEQMITFDCSPALTEGMDFWILGMSELDTETILGY